MDRRTLVMACLAAAKGGSYSPVQIQKLAFIFQERAKAVAGGTFDFRAYDYGPFDAAVYTVLEGLSGQGKVVIEGGPADKRRRYSLDDDGLAEANGALEQIPEPFRDYLVRLSEWVRSQTFGQLVGAVYQHFPHMRANSIFQG